MRQRLYPIMSLVLLLCCCAGICSCFQLDIEQIICKIRAHHPEHQQQMTTIRVAAADFAHHRSGDEVHIDGVLYDITRIEICGNRAMVSLFRDTDEADLINDIVSVFQTDARFEANDKYNHISKHKLYVPDGKVLCAQCNCPLTTFMNEETSVGSFYKTYAVDITANIIKPPPRTIC